MEGYLTRQLQGLQPGLAACMRSPGTTLMPGPELSPLSFSSPCLPFLLLSALLPCSPSSTRLGFCSPPTSGHQVTLGNQGAMPCPYLLRTLWFWCPTTVEQELLSLSPSS